MRVKEMFHALSDEDKMTMASIAEQWVRSKSLGIHVHEIAMWRDGFKADAVRAVRNRTGCSLHEAVRSIEAALHSNVEVDNG